MPKSTLTSKGQVTIPKRIRQRLGLQVGERLDFQVQADGSIRVEPENADKLGRVPGLLRHLAPERPVSVEEMEAAIARRLRERHRQATRR